MGVGVGVGVHAIQGVGVGVSPGQGDPIGVPFTVQYMHATVAGAQGVPQLSSKSLSATDSPSCMQGALNHRTANWFVTV